MFDSKLRFYGAIEELASKDDFVKYEVRGLETLCSMPGFKRKRVRSVRLCLVLGALVIGGMSTSEEEESTGQPIRVDAMFEMMSNQIVDVVCEAPEFRACFDVPYAECSRELRKMLADCRSEMDGRLPELIRADEADPIIEKVYGCVIPKWDSLIKNRRTDTEECRRLERQAEAGEDP